MKICKYCKKQIKLTTKNKHSYHKLKYCSLSCWASARTKIQKKNKTGIFSRNSRLKALRINKFNKTGCYGFSKEERILNSKIAVENNKKKKISFYNPNKKIQVMGGKAVQSILKSKKLGLYGISKEDRIRNGRKGAKNCNKIHKKNHTGLCYDEKFKGLGYEAMIRNKRLFFNKVFYGSEREAAIGLCFNEQIEKIKKRVNFQVAIGMNHLDFVNHKDKCVIEVHQVISWFDHKETDKSYYRNRRKLLDNSSYKDYNLVVLQ